MKIAIDGPAGAGKSTVAKIVADKIGGVYVDTGAMYRAIGLYYLRNGIDIDNKEKCQEKIEEISVLQKNSTEGLRTILNGEDVTPYIRTQEVGEAASKTSAYPFVRFHLLALQREMAEKQDTVMDGRDIGTVVLPNAEVKIFLTASSLCRGERRLKELQEKGIQANLNEIVAEIEERDYRDSHRETAPLRQAEDAIVIDSSNLCIEETVEEILKVIYGKNVG